MQTHWRQHSAAEHGERPQESLNAQLVDEADVVVALFWHRLGSPTGEAESGTSEEIERAHGNGSYVAILRCERDIDPQALDLEQVTRLRTFLGELEPESLMLAYSDEAGLARHIDTILTQAVTRDSQRAEAAAEATIGGAEVWPRVETSESIKTDSKGRIKPQRKWQLVLSNTGEEPARNVRYRLEPENEEEDTPTQLDDDRELEVLPPKGEAAYGLFMHSGVASQARCVVSWEDSAGAKENRATLRFF